MQKMIWIPSESVGANSEIPNHAFAQHRDVHILSHGWPMFPWPKRTFPCAHKGYRVSTERSNVRRKGPRVPSNLGYLAQSICHACYLDVQ
jgi:hypothetical protein